MAPSALPPTKSGSGFLTFNSLPPRLHMTSDDEEFDEKILQDWRDEGFDVTYHPAIGDRKVFANKVKHFADDLELGEAYAIIAYNDAASVVLEVAEKPLPHCCAIICYYPTHILHPHYLYPTQLQMLVHLAGSQKFSPSFKNYRYLGVLPGFAESDLDEYDRVAADLAWTRSLTAIRKGFKNDVDLEATWEDHLALEFLQKNALGTVNTMTPDTSINHVPTMTGGVGKRDLYRFYREHFIPGNPPSMKMRLLSRTIGVDRVVDEILLSFRHTQEMPWILPGVPPTDKQVEVALVMVVCIRAGKLIQENVYWDQASVLVQIGALDPNFVPKDLKSKGMQRQPVVGADAVKKVLDPDSVPSNQLIPKWTQQSRQTSRSTSIAESSAANGGSSVSASRSESQASLPIRS